MKALIAGLVAAGLVASLTTAASAQGSGSGSGMSQPSTPKPAKKKKKTSNLPAVELIRSV
jgi:hypothetical protein